ncbi:MAG: hypothetical protein AB7G23_20690 [Vicinamibacterales bacterium]
MTAANEHTLMDAARHMLVDAHDEAAAIAQLAEEAIAALDERSLLGALGTLASYDAQIAALTRSVEAARMLLLRARDGGGR